MGFNRDFNVLGISSLWLDNVDSVPPDFFIGEFDVYLKVFVEWEDISENKIKKKNSLSLKNYWILIEYINFNLKF